MPYDPFEILSSIEGKHPRLGQFLAMQFLGWISPFNRHLHAKLISWSNEICVIAVKRRRGVRNHVGSIHAGALFTLGETCAGLVIIRNFPFKNFRPLMSDVRVTYTKQARGDVTGSCTIAPAKIAEMHETLRKDEIPTLEATTLILNAAQELIATVVTTWQVKPWQLVKTK